MCDNGLSVNSGVAVRDTCPMRHRVRDCEDAEFVFGSDAKTFEFMFDRVSLHEFMRLATEALREMDEHRAREEAEDDHEPTRLDTTHGLTSGPPAE